MTAFETQEQERQDFIRMIRDSAAAVAPRNGDFRRVRALRYTVPGFDRAVWQEMAGFGWIGLRIPEPAGGAGVGMVESVALYEELGAGLVPEPLIAASLSARVLATTSQTSLLEAVLAGHSLVALAWQEQADPAGMGSGTSDQRRNMPMVGAADHLLVPSRTDGPMRLRLLDPADAAATLVQRQDGSTVAALSVPDQAGTIVADDVAEAIDQALDEATLATSAYLLGVAETAFAITLDYLKQRKQFGQPLAAFQALQHRAADMKIQLTLARASVEGAAAELDDDIAPNRRAAVVSRAKARTAETAMLVGREAVQMHGAIGYADEYDVGLFTRKVMAVANDYGSAIAHRTRFARMTD